MDPPVPLEAVITTAELNQRPARPADHAAVNSALVALMQEMATSPGTILQRLVDIALGLCQAHSAGISLLEDEDGRKIFRWHALAGRYAPHLWGTTPRKFSPCGTVLDRDSPQLMFNPERHYTYFAQVTPPIVEALLIPFRVAGEAVGTVWVIAHDASRRFDAEDLRIMSILGEFAAATYQVLTSLRAVETSNAQLAKAHADLLLSNERLEEQVADRTRAGRRLRLLWEAARILLTSDDADAIIPGLLDKVGQHLELDTLNYMVNETGKALQLESFSGISEIQVREVRRLEFGEGVCGTVALTGQAIVATHIQQSEDPMVRVKGFGIRAFACNPLLAKNRLLGTLSFASRTQDEFTPDELEFLQTISHYVTMSGLTIVGFELCSSLIRLRASSTISSSRSTGVHGLRSGLTSKSGSRPLPIGGSLPPRLGWCAIPWVRGIPRGLAARCCARGLRSLESLWRGMAVAFVKPNLMSNRRQLGCDPVSENPAMVPFPVMPGRCRTGYGRVGSRAVVG
jgi:GAF domain-containing protein